MRTSLLLMMVLNLPNSRVIGNEIQNIKKVSHFMFARSGEDVHMNCTMDFPVTPFTVFWTLEGDDTTLLSDHQSYKGRVIFHFSSRQITIQNVTERDSGMYGCHMETADGKRQAGTVTWLEVTKVHGDSSCTRDTLLLVMEGLRISLLTALIILLVIAIKNS